MRPHQASDIESRREPVRGDAGHDEGDAGRIWSVDEATAAYPREWILMQITGEDENKHPSHGHVIAHGFDEELITSKLVERARTPCDEPGGPYYIFAAYPRVRTGEELRRAIEGLSRDDDFDPDRWHL